MTTSATLPRYKAASISLSVSTTTPLHSGGSVGTDSNSDSLQGRHHVVTNRCVSAEEAVRPSYKVRRSVVSRKSCPNSFSTADLSQFQVGAKSHLGGMSLIPAQINTIRRVWKRARAKGSDEPGLTIFRRLVAEHPDIKLVFSNLSSVGEYATPRTLGPNSACLMRSLKSHSLAFVEVMDKLMEQLDNLLLMDSILIQLGVQHAHHRQYGFKPHHMDVFASVFIDSTLQWSEDKRGRALEAEAWASLVAHMIDRIRQGYHIERRSMVRSSTGNITACCSSR